MKLSLLKHKYYTRLRFRNSVRPSRLDTLFSKPYQVEPKPWNKIATDLYHQLEGDFVEEENYWKNGDLKDSILDLKDKLQKKETEHLQLFLRG